MNDDIKIMFSGSFAGLAQIVTGHPFDTVKVRYIDYKKGSLSQCVKSIQKGGWSNFYRGVYSPMVGSIFMNIKTFYTYSLIERHITENSFISGSITGALLSSIESPTDLIKTRMQLSTRANYIETIRSIGVTNMYKGFNITLSRNIISVGGFFWGYKTVKDMVDNEYMGAVLGGSVAGLLCWGPSYPMDNIKTRIQSSSQRMTIRDACKNVYKEEGLRGFYRGFVPCITRSMFVNPFVFLAYEIGIKHLQ